MPARLPGLFFSPPGHALRPLFFQLFQCLPRVLTPTFEHTPHPPLLCPPSRLVFRLSSTHHFGRCASLTWKCLPPLLVIFPFLLSYFFMASGPALFPFCRCVSSVFRLSLTRYPRSFSFLSFLHSMVCRCITGNFLRTRLSSLRLGLLKTSLWELPSPSLTFFNITPPSGSPSRIRILSFPKSGFNPFPELARSR